jgi:hypothetical protein
VRQKFPDKEFRADCISLLLEYTPIPHLPAAWNRLSKCLDSASAQVSYAPNIFDVVFTLKICPCRGALDHAGILATPKLTPLIVWRARTALHRRSSFCSPAQFAGAS